MSWVDTIKATLTMQEVLERYLGQPDRLKKWLCPFHRDKNPSLSINERTDKFKCFACGESGDLVDFMERYLQCSQKEALLTLSNDFGIQLDTGSRDRPYRTDKIVQDREFERQEEEELQCRCKEQKKFINTALWVSRDIQRRNYPLKGEDMDAFMESKRPNRCMWACVEEQYCLWLLDCLDCIPFNEYEATFFFDLDVLHKNPLTFSEETDNLKWRLGKRRRIVLEKLEKGEIGYIWLFHNNITTSA